MILSHYKLLTAKFIDCRQTRQGRNTVFRYCPLTLTITSWHNASPHELRNYKQPSLLQHRGHNGGEINVESLTTSKSIRWKAAFLPVKTRIDIDCTKGLKFQSNYSHSWPDTTSRLAPWCNIGCLYVIYVIDIKSCFSCVIKTWLITNYSIWSNMWLFK